MPPMLDDATVETFRRDGVVILRGFLARDEVDDLLARIDRFVREVAPSLPAEEVYFEEAGRPESLQRLNRLNRHDPYFDVLRKSDRFKGVAERLLGEAVTEQHMMYFSKPPRVGKATPPHQDAYYWMIEPPVGVTYWLSLGTADEGNGCMRYVKGSHRQSLRPHVDSNVLGFSQRLVDYGPEEARDEICLTADPGDLIVHDGRTIHRADANSSDRPRPALGLVYFAAASEEDKPKTTAYQEKLHSELKADGKI